MTNGLAFLIFLLHFIISLTHIFTNKIRFADIFITIFNFIAFPLLIFRTLPFIKGKSIMAQILISPSPDILILLLTGVIAWTILIISDQSYLRTGASENKTYLMDERVIPLFLSIGAVSMKLTAIPILLVTSFFYLFKKPLSIQRFLILILIIFLLLSPMLIFGVMTSGCPLSPSTFMCVNLPWSPLSLNTTALSTQKIGVDWALLGRPSDGDNFWLWILWKWSKSSILNLIIILLNFIAVIGVFLGLFFINKKSLLGAIWVLLIGIVGMIIIFKQAPELRYGIGYFILIPTLIAAIFFDKIFLNIKAQVNWQKFLLAPSNFLVKKYFNKPMFFVGLATVFCIQGIAQSRLFLPPALPTVELAKAQINDIEYVYPSPLSALCWGSQLPCTLGPIPINIQLRDPSKGISAGFVYVKKES
nr:hypothetical protein [Gloeothece verrucosa]